MGDRPTLLPKGYRYAGLLFLLLSLGLLILISSSTFGRAEVILTAATTRTSGRFVVTVREQPAPNAPNDPTAVPGRVSVQEITTTITLPATGKGQRTSDVIGSVALVNTTDRSQVLVATTRLLSSDGTLLRLKERVVVPANGAVAADVYPDNRLAFRGFPPSRFTIPGLASALQPLIYASSSAPLAAGDQVAAVTEADLSAATETVTAAIRDQALQQFEGSLGERERLFTKIVQHEVLSSEVGARAGELREEFPVSAKLRVVAVAFNDAHLIGFIRQELSQGLPFTHRLQAVDEESLTYQLERYDQERREASINVYAEGRSTLHPSSPLLNPASIAGFSREQIAAHFKRYPEIASVEVRFFPESLRRSPQSPSRITFTVK